MILAWGDVCLTYTTIISWQCNEKSALLSPQQILDYRYFGQPSTVFTGRNEVVAKVMFLQACVSTGGGRGVCLSACWDTPPDQTPPLTRPPRIRHTPPGPGTPPRIRHTPQDQAHPPPRKQTPAYGLRAAGTHPTWMHSFLSKCVQQYVYGVSHTSHPVMQHQRERYTQLRS